MKYKSNKIVTAVLAILLVIVIAGAAALVGVLSDGFKDWTKFQPDEQTETPADEVQGGEEELPVLDDEGNEMESGVVHEMPKAMTFRTAASLAATPAAQAETYDSVTLTATVKPDSAADKTVDWAVAFVNPSSEWATGKTVTDYVTVTPSSDGSTTATVKCLRPFGEQIKVTVTSRTNANATASCTVDFSARLGGYGLVGFTQQADNDFVFLRGLVPLFWATSGYNSSYVYEVNAMAGSDIFASLYQEKDDCTVSMTETDHTVGTLTLNSFSIQAKPSDSFYNALQSQGIAYSSNDYRSIFVPTSDGNGREVSTFFIYSSLVSSGSLGFAELTNKMNVAIQNASGDYDFEFKVTLNTSAGDYENTFKFKFYRDGVQFTAQDIELSDSNVVI